MVGRVRRGKAKSALMIVRLAPGPARPRGRAPIPRRTGRTAADMAASARGTWEIRPLAADPERGRRHRGARGLSASNGTAEVACGLTLDATARLANCGPNSRRTRSGRGLARPGDARACGRRMRTPSTWARKPGWLGLVAAAPTVARR